MPGSPKPRVAPRLPSPQRLAFFGEPRTEPQRAGEQQAGHGRGPAAARPGTALQHAKAAVLADFLWKRQKPGRGRPESFSGGSASRADSDVWRDQQLAEVQELAEALRQKVARYSTLRAALFSAEAPEPANETAVLWIQEALEDIAATALGIQITSRELYFQVASAGEPDPAGESVRNHADQTGE